MGGVDGQDNPDAKRDECLMSKSTKALLPCSTCPWRTDQDATVIPYYVHEKACNLLSTVGDGNAFRPIMACHGSTDTEMIACKGYLAREGWNNLNVRVMLIEDRIENPSKVADACDEYGVELEPDYPAVLAKLEWSR